MHFYVFKRKNTIFFIIFPVTLCVAQLNKIQQIFRLKKNIVLYRVKIDTTSRLNRFLPDSRLVANKTEYTFSTVASRPYQTDHRLLS